MFHKIPMFGAIADRSGVRSKTKRENTLEIISTYKIILVQKVNAGSRKKSVIGLVERLVSREVRL